MNRPKTQFPVLTVIDGGKRAAYVPVLVQEKVPSPLKDIAIYRLQRVEKALERLNQAVGRLDSAASTLKVETPEPDSDHDGQNDQYDLAQAELTALKADYDRLHEAATTVAGRLDETIERLEAESAGSPQQKTA